MTTDVESTWIGNRPFFYRSTCPRCKSQYGEEIWNSLAYRLCDKCFDIMKAEPMNTEITLKWHSHSGLSKGREV